MDETKICKKCGRILPIQNFRLATGQFGNPYYRGSCKECEVKYDKEYKKKKNEKEFTFSDNLEILVDRQYKEINPKRILEVSALDIDITLMGTDEIFVKLMDYKDTWLSNYGQCITMAWGKYNLLQGSYINGELRYSLKKNVFIDGKWTYKHDYVYAPKMVVETFIVNEDKANNVYIWHSGHDKEDCYYRNLYPLNQEQFRIVNNHFQKTGDDSEQFILNVMNDIRYKPDNWSKQTAKRVMYGVGYHGILYTNSNEESYKRWHWIMNRCYSNAIHELQPEYKECTVCEEWKNYSNFKLWYEQHIIEIRMFDEAFELDKDILIKGNTVYSPETVCFVPKMINSVLTNGKKNRGDYPLGVYFDKDKKKYVANMSFAGKNIKLGAYETAEAAFTRYKEYKEDFIKDIAEQHKDKIPDKIYQAMMNWQIEITD